MSAAVVCACWWGWSEGNCSLPETERWVGGGGGDERGWGKRGGTSSLTCRFMCFCQGLVTLDANYSCFSSAGKLDNGHPLQYFQSLKINLHIQTKLKPLVQSIQGHLTLPYCYFLHKLMFKEIQNYSTVV